MLLIACPAGMPRAGRHAAPSVSRERPGPSLSRESLPGQMDVPRFEDLRLPLTPGMYRRRAALVVRPTLAGIGRDPVHGREQLHAVRRLDPFDGPRRPVEGRNVGPIGLEERFGFSQRAGRQRPIVSQSGLPAAMRSVIRLAEIEHSGQ